MTYSKTSLSDGQFCCKIRIDLFLEYWHVIYQEKNQRKNCVKKFDKCAPTIWHKKYSKRIFRKKKRRQIPKIRQTWQICANFLRSVEDNVPFRAVINILAKHKRVLSKQMNKYCKYLDQALLLAYHHNLIFHSLWILNFFPMISAQRVYKVCKEKFQVPSFIPVWRKIFG